MARLIVVLWLGAWASAFSAVTVQWDFNGTLASTTGGANLIPAAAAPAGTPGIMFTNVSIDGQLANVAAFTRGTFLRLTHGFDPNGGGARVNSYTLIMDVMFPSRPTGWAALWQTDPNNGSDGEWFVNPSGGVGISGNYGGLVPDGAWHRLALVLDAPSGTFTSFINGQQVQQNTGVTIDGRWALETTALLFADDNQENAGGFVNSVQLRNEALSALELEELGGPAARGIPRPTAPSVRLLTPNGGEVFSAGSTQTVTWTARNPSGLLRIELYRDTGPYRSLAQVAMRQSNFVWRVDPRLGDGSDYRVKLTAISAIGVEDFSDGAFTVFGSLSEPNPRFGQALQTNGGFEELLNQWQTILGAPLTLTGSSGKGPPRSGARFLHGGLNRSGSSVVRQEIDLLEAGFTGPDIDLGASLDATAWLHNWFGPGVFDDQVFYRVAFLDADGDQLSSVRCMVAANDVWLQQRLTSLVPPGTRRLRVEVVGNHRRDADNDSMADDLLIRLQEVSQFDAPQITKLPMLQDVRPDAMTLLWETDGNLALHTVDWGLSNVTERTITDIETLQIDATHFVHRTTITGLEAETSYVYRVRSGGTSTAAYAFRTAPRRETAFAVAWWGDNHDGSVTLRTHIDNMLAHGPDLIAVAGDMVNNGNSLSEWHYYWFEPLEHRNLAQTTPIIFARGNHDGEHALAYAYSALPGNESWFAFDYGNTRFIFLDSEVSTSGSPEQFAWLQAELNRPETRQAAFRIVCFHRPPWVNLWNGGGYTGEIFVRNDWVPVLERGGVDIVICGHAHNYNRGFRNGIAYVVSGGGGGFLDTERVANWPHFTVEYSRYHFDLMEVNGEMLNWEVYDSANQLIDTFQLRSRVPDLEWQSLTPRDETLPLSLRGRPGLSYVLESSSNLITWTALATNTIPTNGLPAWTNSVSVNAPQRFFRARMF